MKKSIIRLVKVAFTIILLAFVLRNANLHDILLIIKDSNFSSILLALLSFSLYQLLFAYNWKRVLKTLKEKVHYPDLLRIHMIGLFYNLFLPTSMGGDVAKIFYLSKRLENRIISIKSIALLRGIGLLTNLMILSFSLAFNRELLDIVSYNRSILHSAYIITGLITILSIINRTGIVQTNRMKAITNRIREYICRIRAFLEEFKFEMLSVVIISLLNQLIIILENFLICRSLHMDIAFVNMMYIIPLTFLATLLPITIAGIGIREGAFIFFLTRYNYTVENAIAFSLIGYLLVLIMGFSGGIVNAVTSQGGNDHKYAEV